MPNENGSANASSAAAHEPGLHPITVCRWIKAGRIQVIPVGREARILRIEVERLVGKIEGRGLSGALRRRRRGRGRFRRG